MTRLIKYSLRALTLIAQALDPTLSQEDTTTAIVSSKVSVFHQVCYAIPNNLKPKLRK